jgi:hypothetical protein
MKIGFFYSMNTKRFLLNNKIISIFLILIFIIKIFLEAPPPFKKFQGGRGGRRGALEILAPTLMIFL